MLIISKLLPHSSVPQHYCLEPDDRIAEEPPKLLHSCRPHLDRVTHLETCIHGDKLLLLSASSDCNVALSYLPRDIIGLFGQVQKCTDTYTDDVSALEWLELHNTTWMFEKIVLDAEILFSASL